MTIGMESADLYGLAADGLLVVHVLFVLFVVGGLLLIWVGKFRRWGWVRHAGFRIAHLAAIGVVVLQAWLGKLCPLTTWEMELRRKAGGSTYEGSFIAHWLGELLYYDAPMWVFAVAYTVFGGLVVASWMWVWPGKGGGG